MSNDTPKAQAVPFTENWIDATAKQIWWHSPRTNWGELEATITAAMLCFTHRDRIQIGKLNIVRAEAGQ